MKKRIEWIDTLRGIAMFIVVLGHALPEDANWLRMYIYSFHMPLFFFISGLSSHFEKDRGFKNMLINKTKKLLIPYFVLNLALYIVVILLNIVSVALLGSKTFWQPNIFNFLKSILISNSIITPLFNGVTWFIATLFITSVVFYFVKKFIKNRISTTLVITLLLFIGTITSASTFMGMSKLHLPWHIEALPFALIFMIIGNLFMKNYSKIESYIRNINFLYLTPVILLSIFLPQINTVSITMYGNRYGNFLIFWPAVLLSFFAYTVISIEINKTHVLTYIGKNTFIVLGFHLFIMRSLVYRLFPFLEYGYAYNFIISIMIFMSLYLLTIIYDRLIFHIKRKVPNSQ